MSAFDTLHPALQHHIVNTLGWKQLRPLQEAAIEPLARGEHALLLAPTAGGKTEAAIFPLLSRMLSEDWRGLGVLYVCPIKALLNNLFPRLEGYAELVGRRVALWHGDVGPSARKKILASPPDLLLTTPESIEVMLTSTRTDHRALLRDVRCAVVDELHAFAGDDRGWHLLSVLERVSRLAKGEIQRLGLSATVGNPEELLGWLAGSAAGPRAVLVPPANAIAAPEARPKVTLDFVGSLENAAQVIASLHLGEKRLVFCDSRSRVEELSADLRERGVKTFVSHSSLGLEERRQAERAFSEEREAVIVATSTLELGIDVGDLDRVIQIDAPVRVSSFLQRIGRTGRREGATRNCLFLATGENAFLRTAGLLRLWSEGYVEPVEPPPAPYHILAQQIMALVLQEGRIGRHTWRDWLKGMPAFESMAPGLADVIIDYMLEQQILFEEEGMLSMGREGERSFGRRHFMELMSVFTTDPLFLVRYGRKELGQVHPLSFTVRKDEEPVLLLAGRSWVVTYVDWREHVAYVEISAEKGRSQWLGSGQPLHFELCRAVRRVLCTGEVGADLTSRAQHALEEARDKAAWIDDESTAVVRHADGSLRWWTFAGLRANSSLVEALGGVHMSGSRGENLCVQLQHGASWREVEERLARLDPDDAASRVPVSEEALDGLKFSSCLPKEVAISVLHERLADPAALKACVAERVRFIDDSA